MIAFSLVIATIFLGGWQGPLLPGYLWIAIKGMIVVSLFIWVRATLPRLRVDQVMALGWKFLLPVAALNLFVTGAEVLTYPQGLPLWLIPLNFLIALAVLVFGSRALRF